MLVLDFGEFMDCVSWKNAFFILFFSSGSPIKGKLDFYILFHIPLWSFANFYSGFFMCFNMNPFYYSDLVSFKH